MNPKRRWIFFLCAGVLGQAIVLDSLTASDASAISEIFADQHTPESAWTVHQRVAKLTAEERFEFLTNWILPGDTHDTWRLQIGFTPTNPPPNPSDLESSEVSGKRVVTGGQLVSPVFDWLETARELGKLDAVIKQVRAIPIDDGSEHRISQLAVVMLAEWYRGNTTAFADSLNQFIKVTPVNLNDGPSDAEWLVYEHCVRHGLHRNDVAHAVYRYFSWTRTNYALSVKQQQWNRLIGMTRRTIVETLPEDEQPKVHSLGHWIPASRMSARVNAEGRPPAVWDVHHGHAENLVSYQHDFLYYAIPLQGTFEIHWEAQVFDWQDTHLLVGRRWVFPSYKMDEYEIGNYRVRFSNRKLSRKLTKARNWFRMRVAVEGNTVTTYVNGLEVHREVTNYEISPWIAIRSDNRRDGCIRNLRIIGNPTIPDRIPLLTGSDLSSWSSYFDVPVGQESGGWIQQDGMLKSDMTALPDHHVERLLQYQRPMCEDGVIDYEFYYTPGQYQTHPAIGQLAFLLEPEGVKLHRVTNGRYERTELDPANVSVEPANQIGGNLPLKPAEWNRMRVELQGDTLTLTLNDEPIYRHQLAATNSRTFGYFQFIDRSQVIVRNAVHRGDWPRKLPELSEQEMAIEEYDPFDGKTEHLTDTFQINFANNPWWYSKFQTYRGHGIRDTEVTDRGLVAVQSSEKGYRGTSISPKLKLKGDFNIVAEFEDFQATTTPGGNSTLYLIVYFDTPENDEHSVTRRQIHDADGNTRHQCQCIVVQNSPKAKRRNHFSNTPMEEHAGKLRLTRTGNTLTYFTAEGDSPFFDFRGKIEALNDRADVREIRLVAQILDKGHVHVVWKSLSIQAENITGDALETISTDVTQLDKQREKLPDEFSHDFTKSPPTTNFAVRSQTPTWNPQDNGWRISAVGGRSWLATGFQTDTQIEGDFDLSANFEVRKIPKHKNTDLSAVYLQIELPTDNSDQINALFENAQGGESVRFQLGELGEDVNAKRNYSLHGLIPLKDITGLRICRYGTRLVVLAKSKRFDTDVYVGERKVTDGPIPPFHIRYMVHTRGEGLETVVLLKSIDFRAEKIVALDETPRPLPPQPNMPIRPQPIKPPPRKSLFDTLRDLFR
ncbi:DUF1583 domain-containing protein [Thalassoroseus pseudoceratinae]|uniref:DUF1583 domain-containing protein n=1 Tax=Thalassoroseus pseudoceratinae TaxID=2713176 RepID=UPI0014237CED|nr:DUF1583 domain-containing protein [Thalassoroseus pseudoceratinae]